MIVGSSQVLSSTSEWEIDNYSSSYSNLEVGKLIRSPTFIVHGFSWHLELYPNGIENKNNSTISLFLNINNDVPVTNKIQAKFALSLLDAKKNIVATHESGKMFSFSHNCGGWGRRELFDETLLAKYKSITSSDKITIICEIIVKEVKAYKTILSISPDRLQHFEGLKNWINNPKFSDVTFTVENKEIFAHKMILSSNSTVFAAMFQHKMRESEENSVTIEDISYDVFSELLHFMYTGECTFSEDTTIELFAAADKYQLLKMKNMCEEELCKSLCIDNAIALLQSADMHSAKRLKEEAIEFIVLNGKEVIDKPEFGSIGNNTELLKDVFRGFLIHKNGAQ